MNFYFWLPYDEAYRTGWSHWIDWSDRTGWNHRIDSNHRIDWSHLIDSNYRIDSNHWIDSNHRIGWNHLPDTTKLESWKRPKFRFKTQWRRIVELELFAVELSSFQVENTLQKHFADRNTFQKVTFTCCWPFERRTAAAFPRHLVQ